MLVRTPTELGAVIRDRRKQLRLDQANLARQIGASRQWLIEVEHGHARAELGLVLRLLAALDIRIDVAVAPKTRAGSAADIDTIIAAAKKKT